MKTVHAPDMVAHLWAHQSQYEARNAGGSFYFREDTIFSYGGHFPIARHVKNRRGETAVLFTARDHSVTTQRHKSIAARACRHLRVFTVADVMTDIGDKGTAREMFHAYRERLTAAMQSYTRARVHKSVCLQLIHSLVSEANAFAQFCGLSSRLSVPGDPEQMAAECEELERKAREHERRESAKRRKAEAEHEAKRQAALEAWANGGDVCSFYFGSMPVRLRIHEDELQTSHGATVPLEHARKAFRVLAKLRANGETYHRNGHSIHIGAFVIDSMEGEEVRAGCHRVAWAEIERVARLAGELK